MEARTRLRQGVTAPRVVLSFGILVGILALVASIARLFSGPELDFHAYYFAAEAVLQGDPFVGYAVKDGNFLTRKEYVYVPITVLSFLPYGIFPNWQVPYVIHAGVLVASLLLLARLSIQYVESHGRSLDRIDQWLIRGFFVLSLPAVLGIYRGNVDPIILAMLVGGFFAVERSLEAVGGSLWAVASLYKLFPAMLGIWLLYRRKFVATAAAIAVGLGSLALSVLAFGVDANVEFVEFILEERSRKGAYEGGLDVEFMYLSLKRPLSYLVPVAGHALTALAFLIVAPFLALLYHRASSERDQLIVLFGTIAVLLVTVVPSTAGYVVYLLFPLVPLIYLTENRRARLSFLAGLALINVPVFPRHIQQLSENTSLSAGIGDPILTVVQTVLTFGSVALWGVCLIFAGCLLAIPVGGEES